MGKVYILDIIRRCIKCCYSDTSGTEGGVGTRPQPASNNVYVLSTRGVVF